MKEEQKDKVINRLTTLSIFIKNFINAFIKKIFSINLIDKSKEILVCAVLYVCLIINKYLCLFMIMFYLLRIYNSIISILNTFFKNENISNCCISLFFTLVVYTMFMIQNVLLPLWSFLLVYVIKNIDIILARISFVAEKTMRIMFLFLSITVISILFSLIFNYSIFNFIMFNFLLGISVFFINKYIYNYFINYGNRDIIFCCIYTILICCVLNIFNIFGVISL